MCLLYRILDQESTVFAKNQEKSVGFTPHFL